MVHPQESFRALSDPTRREILVLLRDGPMTIAEVADNFDMTRAAVKKHLSILNDGALITVEPRGRTRVNRLNPQGFRPIFDWFGFFDAFWDERLAELKSQILKELNDD